MDEKNPIEFSRLNWKSETNLSFMLLLCLIFCLLNQIWNKKILKNSKESALDLVTLFHFFFLLQSDGLLVILFSVEKR